MIKTALCSFGMSGWVFHAPFIDAHPSFELYAVAERSKKTAVEKYPGIKSYDSVEEMLQDESIELVIVNTPNYTHFDFAKKALLAGKHVVVEKPFTINVAEAGELITLAQQQNKKIAVYHNRRWDSDFKTVKQVLDEKLLGDVIEAEFHFDRFSEVLSVKQHKETPGPGAGNLYDLGSHLIDQALQLFGLPKAVFADATAMRPISSVDDYFELLLFYPRHRVRLHSSYQVREALPAYIIHGSKGSFIKPRGDVQEADLQGFKPLTDADWGLEPATAQGLLHTEKDNTIIKQLIPSLTGNYLAFYEGLSNALLNDGPLPVTAEEGRNVIRIIEAAYQSVQQKAIIHI